MRHVVSLLACVLFLSTVSHANDLLLYFSNQGDNSMVPDEFTNTYNPAYGGGPIYLWAFLGERDEWDSLALDVTENTALDVSIQYNPTLGTAMRWNPNSDLDFVPDNHTFAVAVQEFGLGNALEQMVLPDYSVPGTRHFLVGELNLGAPDFVDEFLAVGTGGIARRGSNPVEDSIYIGFDLMGNWDGPLRGNDIGATTPYPDIVPEPAGLVLLGVAVLALGRRGVIGATDGTETQPP